MVIFFREIKSFFYINCTFLLEFFKSSHVFVNEEPKISKTTISTNALSTCLFFLMKFRLNDHPYAFLVHHEKLCNPKMSAPQLLVHLLNDIVYYVKDILHEDFYFKESFNFTDIKNINLLVGGGTPTLKKIGFALCNEFETLFRFRRAHETIFRFCRAHETVFRFRIILFFFQCTEHNNIRQAFGLLINRDQLISNIILDLFKGNEDCQYLTNNLFNNTKILNATSYSQSTKELNEE